MIYCLLTVILGRPGLKNPIRPKCEFQNPNQESGRTYALMTPSHLQV